MNKPQPPMIFGLPVDGRTIVFGGVVIAVAVISIRAILAPPIILMTGLFVATFAVTLVLLAARLLLRRRPQPTPVVMLFVVIKLMNMVAVTIIGLLTLVLFVIDRPLSGILAEAFVGDLMLAVIISVLSQIAANAGALLASPSPPKAPSA